MQHLLVTRHFLPELSGASRRFVSIARSFPEPMAVSTVSDPDAARSDPREEFAIERQPFTSAAAASWLSRFRWERWLSRRADSRVHVLHCGDIAVAGRVVQRSHKRLGIPYIVHVSRRELVLMRHEARASRAARRTLRLVLGDSAGIIATTEPVADIVREVMTDLRLSDPPPVRAIPVGADPELFSPGRDSGTLRQRWGVRRAPILLTVGRLESASGLDIGIQAIALLRDEFPRLRYVLVGEGSDEARLRNLAADLNVMDLIGFAGAMRDDELPEAYATSTIYLDASRADPTIAGHGMSLMEAQAAGLPVIATDGPDVRSIVREGESAVLLPTASAELIAESVAGLLRDPDRRITMSLAGRQMVESETSWKQIARDTARFVRECVANG